MPLPPTSSVRLPVVGQGAGVLFRHQASVHAVHGHVSWVPSVSSHPSIQLCRGQKKKKGQLVYVSRVDVVR